MLLHFGRRHRPGPLWLSGDWCTRINGRGSRCHSPKGLGRDHSKSAAYVLRCYDFSRYRNERTSWGLVCNKNFLAAGPAPLPTNVSNHPQGATPQLARAARMIVSVRLGKNGRRESRTTGQLFDPFRTSGAAVRAPDCALEFPQGQYPTGRSERMLAQWVALVAFGFG